MSPPRVCVIVLNWNGLSDTVECLESLRKLGYPNYSVIVVDNASKGDDVEVLRQRYGDYAYLIKNDRNYGFAEGNNIGIRYALGNLKPDYYMLLNNDTVMAPDVLDELVAVGEKDDRIGVIGPKIYYYDMNGRKDIIWSAGGVIRWWHPWIYDGIGCGEQDHPLYDECRPVAWVSGAAMMLKRQVLDDMSLLNADYFSGNEDVEYCLKARRHGFEVVYVPTAHVWHKVGRARPHPTSMTQGSAEGQITGSQRKSAKIFSDLPPYYHLIKRNFSAPFYVYHLLLLPLLAADRLVSHLTRVPGRRS